jgi:hypothetical protein
MAVQKAAEVVARRQIRRLQVLNHDKRLCGRPYACGSLPLGRWGGAGALKGISERTDTQRREWTIATLLQMPPVDL